MSVDTAVILAAGLGVRLGGMSAQRPKGFIELGGEPIIERSIRLLAAAGIARTVIVTGHLAEFYRALAARHPGIELVHNPSYAESGAMYSLYLARELPKGDFLLLESDLIYEQRALGALLAAPGRDVLLVSGRTDSGDEVYVTADAGHRLTGLSKHRAELHGEVIGELVGITRMSPDCLAAMCTHAAPVFATTLRLDYEPALVAAARSIHVHCLRVSDLIWTEIDDERHLERARTVIHPAIAARGL